MYTTALGTACTKVYAYAPGVGSPDDYHLVLFICPDSYDMTQAGPAVSVKHGVGNNETIILPSGGVGGGGMTDAWLDHGWPVLSTNQGGISWGNQSARVGFVDVWAWWSSIFTNCTGTLEYGVSMGGCAALNYLLDAKSLGLPVLACALNSPATNFQWTYDHNTSLKPAMRTAYGLGSVSSSDPTYVAAVDTADGGHDPQKQTAAEFPAIPFRSYAPSGDATISEPNNAYLFDTKLTSGGWVVDDGITTNLARSSVVACSGAHTGPDTYRPADCITFFDRAL